MLWVGALLLATRAARKQGGGMEAAVRISALVTGAILVLGLFAQPDIAGVSVSSSPLLAALGALVLSLLVTGGVLQQGAAAQWLAQRPAAHAVVRATGTAVRALGAVIALCALIGFIAYANVDGVDGTAMLLTLPVLPNIGLAVLGVSWGAPVEYDVRGEFGWFGSGMEHGGFGLSELGDAVNGWAVTGAVLTGVICALYAGVSAVRRSADRREQAIAGGLFLVLYLLLTGFSGVSAQLSGDVAGVGGRGMAEIAPSVPDALLFGLLWVGERCWWRRICCGWWGVRPARWLRRRRGVRERSLSLPPGTPAAGAARDRPHAHSHAHALSHLVRPVRSADRATRPRSGSAPGRRRHSGHRRPRALRRRLERDPRRGHRAGRRGHRRSPVPQERQERPPAPARGGR